VKLSEKIADLLAKAEKATPGPWYSETREALGEIWDRITSKSGPVCKTIMRNIRVYEQSVFDGRYIAACDPDTIRQLCERLLELERMNTFYKETFEKQQKFIEGAINDKLALKEAREVIAGSGKTMPTHHNLVGSHYHEGLADQAKHQRKRARDWLEKWEEIK
jgi:hypothetical protein